MSDTFDSNEDVIEATGNFVASKVPNMSEEKLFERFLVTQSSTETIKDLPAESSTLFLLNSSLPAAYALLGARGSDCFVFTESFPRPYQSHETLRDRTVKFAGISGSMPHVFLGLADSKYGVTLYQTHVKDLTYVSISFLNQYGYAYSYLVAKRSQAVALHNYFRKQNLEFSKTNLISQPPLLPPGFLEEVLKNSIDFLINHEKFAAYGVRPARGLVLRGEPGNGKTMTCKWIQVLAVKHGLSVVTYTTADIEQSYKDDSLPELMTGYDIIFFDDIDISFLSRRKGNDSNSKMACALLSAMDGIGDNKKGVARIFTTNEAVIDIDDAFLRPGRIDKVLTFEPPTASLRKQVINQYWNKDIVSAIDIEALVASSDGNSFADLEEIKTLLVQGFIFDGVWNLNKALEDFKHRKDTKPDMELVTKEEKNDQPA